MAVAVVRGALFGVGEDLVGLAAGFELLFGLGIVGVAVRVVLHSQLAVAGLQFLVVRGTRDLQHLVEIHLHVGGGAHWFLELWVMPYWLSAWT